MQRISRNSKWAMRILTVLLTLVLAFPYPVIAKGGTVRFKVKYDLITEDFKNLEEPDDVFEFFVEIPEEFEDYKKLLKAAAVEACGDGKNDVHKVQRKYDNKLEVLKTKRLKKKQMKKAVKKINRQMDAELDAILDELDDIVQKTVLEEMKDIAKRKKMRVNKGRWKKVRVVVLVVVGVTTAVVGLAAAVGAGIGTAGTAGPAAIAAWIGAVTAGAAALGGVITTLVSAKDAYNEYTEGPLRRDAGEIKKLLEGAEARLLKKKPQRVRAKRAMNKADREMDRLISAWEKQNRVMYGGAYKDVKKKFKALNKKMKQVDVKTLNRKQKKEFDAQKIKLAKYKTQYSEFKDKLNEITGEIRAAINFSKDYKKLLAGKCAKLGNAVKNKPSAAEVNKCRKSFSKRIPKFEKAFTHD